MRAEELRLLNWVSNTHGIPMIVKAIYEDTVYVDFKGNVGGLWEFNRYEPFTPIQLTEEILLKCGFEQSAWDNYSTFRNLFCSDGCIVISLEHKYIEIGDLTLDIEIKHLHQLQNLYFALTGKELECIL